MFAVVSMVRGSRKHMQSKQLVKSYNLSPVYLSSLILEILAVCFFWGQRVGKKGKYFSVSAYVEKRKLLRHKRIEQKKVRKTIKIVFIFVSNILILVCS